MVPPLRKSKKTYLVVMTRFNEERATTRRLRESFETVLLQYLDDRYRPRILFPSYVFVEHDASRIHEVISTRGVQRVLMTAGAPDLLSLPAMRALRARENEDGYIVLSQSEDAFERQHTNTHSFTKGQRLLVRSGPYRDHTVFYHGMTPNQRVKVLFSLLGQPIAIPLRRRDLVAA